MTEQLQSFGVIDSIAFPETSFKGFSYLTGIRGLQIVVFTPRNLADPLTEPIGLFYVGGTRRYVWRDKYWADFDIPYSPMIAAISAKLRGDIGEVESFHLRKVLDTLRSCKDDSGPTLQDHIDSPCPSRQFYRTLYEVNE